MENNNNSLEAKSNKKDKKEKEATLAGIKEISLSDFVNDIILSKSLDNNEINKLLNLELVPKSMLDIMNNISRDAEYSIIKNVFKEKYDFKIILDNNLDIPIIIKELFASSSSLPKKGEITSDDIKNILQSNFIPFDIKNDSISLLMRTPEFEKDFQSKVMPLLKWKKLKKVDIILTSKELFEYYKQILVYNEISDEI